MDVSLKRSSMNLEPPRKSVELEDAGARDLESTEDEEDHFSDAREDTKRADTPSSPIPRTRVERVDDTPSHGEMPGSPAYQQRLQDAVPDEVEIVPEGRLSKRNSRLDLDQAVSPGGTPIPLTVVEKVDPSAASHGDVPGTKAYRKREADAAPDVILKAPEVGRKSTYTDPDIQHVAPGPEIPIPATVVTAVDSPPTDGEMEGHNAGDTRGQDARPDELDGKRDGVEVPQLEKSGGGRTHALRKSSMRTMDNESDDQDEEHGDFGEDFDDFEEGDETGADDDFGDFDNDFEELGMVEDQEVVTDSTSREPSPSFPLVHAEAFTSLPDLLAATQVHLDAMFPNTTADKMSSIPQSSPIPANSPIFPTERSRSLWKQLITPPPLQPPNWTKSRIRRLFLVSLGVPVDLDEILPPSKQKKLVLPDINLEASPRKSESDKTLGSIARLKEKAANDSSASVNSSQSQPKTKTRRQRGPPPPPELDLTAVKRLCATTNEKLAGFDEAELEEHIKELNACTEKVQEVLEYWLKRRDGARREKEAFEGVIENLVRHARRVRK